MFTRQQALDEGWTPRQVRRRTESGTWRRLAGKALVHRTLQPDALAWAWAVGVTWPDAVVSHRTAALLHGFPMSPTPEGRPEEAHAIAPRGRRRAVGIRAHEASLGTDDVCFFDDLAVTSARRTAVDCLAEADIEVGGRVIAVADVLFPAEHLILEVDGWSSHRSREAFVTDRRRQRALSRAGYLVLRFTWDDLVGRPEETLEEIRDGLARQRTALTR